jgi:hypothetical protein
MKHEYLLCDYECLLCNCQLMPVRWVYNRQLAAACDEHLRL